MESFVVFAAGSRGSFAFSYLPVYACCPFIVSCTVFRQVVHPADNTSVNSQSSVFIHAAGRGYLTFTLPEPVTLSSCLFTLP